MSTRCDTGAGASGRAPVRLLWWVGVTVTVAHLAAAAVLSRSVGALYEDGGHFHLLATRLAESLDYGPVGFEAARPPGWPIVLAGAYRVFGAHPNVGLILLAVCAGLASAALLRLGVRLQLTRLQAALAALGYGLFPWMLVVGSSLYAETAFNLLTIVLCELIVVCRGRQSNPLWWSVIGALAAFATLVRPVLAFWLPVLFVLAVRRRRYWRAGLCVLAGVTLILGSWSWRNYERLDAFVPLTTAGGVTLALANNDLAGSAQERRGLPVPPTDELANDRFLRDFALTWIREHPEQFVGRIPGRVVRTFDPVTRLNAGVSLPPSLRWATRSAWLVLLALAAVGIARRHAGAWFVPLSLAVLLTAPVTLFGGGFRFLIPALPFLALWIVVGADWVGKRLGHLRPGAGGHAPGDRPQGGRVSAAAGLPGAEGPRM